jgi:predicted metalloprotease with PDZ domain
VRTTDLWWSEGVTDWFGDEITRRAGLTSDSAARAELSDLIASYLNNPASTRISPERSSWTAWDTPAANGGYSISYYTQGAILGAMLELVLRDATGTRAGMDDVMRLLYDRFAAARGFTGEELLNAVNGTCGCDLQSFFQSHVSGAQPIDFDRYLNLAGWRLVTTRAIATDSLGPKPDMRASVIAFAGVGSAGGAAGNRPKLSVGDPTSAWGRAGITTGDELVSIDGRPIANESDFKSATGKARVGETLRVSYVRDGVRHDARVVLTTYQTTKVRIEPLPSVSERQRAVRAAWLLGASAVSTLDAPTSPP